MTVKEMIQFRSTVEAMLSLIQYEEKYISTTVVSRRECAAKTLDFMYPRLRNIVQFYIKKFCDEKAIASNPAFLSSLRVDILEKVREHTDVELPKTYARLLKTPKR